MKVILDSCIVMSEKFLFDTANTKQLIRASDDLNIEIVLPAVVVDEVKHLYEQEIEEKLREFRKAYRNLAVILEDRIPDPSEGLDAHSLAFFFGGRFENGLKRGGRRDTTFRVADYPSVSHRDAVFHAIQRHKPFADKKDGYRDYLIWETVLEEASSRTNSGPVYFISSNKDDYAESKAVNIEVGPIELHHDLVFYMEIRGFKREDVVYYGSLSSFNRDVIHPTLVNLEALGKSVTDGAFANPGLYEAFPDAIMRWLDSHSREVALESFSLPNGIINVEGGYLDEIKERGQSRVLMQPDGGLTILIPIHVRVNLFVVSSKNSEFAQNLDESRIVHEREDELVAVYKKDLAFLINALVGPKPDHEIIRVDAILRTPPKSSRI